MANGESSDDLSSDYVSNNQPYILNSEVFLENSDDSSRDQFKNTPLREQDRFLPIANIAKIMRRAVPDNGKVAKDAREIVQECVSEFISFITSEASDRCRFEKRKTINGDDILYAMITLGFDNYVEPLKVYLQKYREMTLASNRIVEKHATEQIGYENTHNNSFEYSQVQLLSENEQQNNTIVYEAYSNNMNEFQLQ